MLSRYNERTRVRGTAAQKLPSTHATSFNSMITTRPATLHGVERISALLVAPEASAACPDLTG